MEDHISKDRCQPSTVIHRTNEEDDPNDSNRVRGSRHLVGVDITPVCGPGTPPGVIA